MPSLVSRELIEARAYEIWEKEGRPEGRDLDHWSKAAEELVPGSAPAKPRKKAAAASNGHATPVVTEALVPAKPKRTAKAK